MKLLEQKIIEKGKVLPNSVLKVGAFLNNQLDIDLLSKMGKEVYKKFKHKKVTKILTVEASGIAFACLTAQWFKCDVIFAKKSKTSNVEGGVFSSSCFSYTHQNENQLIVPKEYLSSSDKVLLIDDFLAHGEALKALNDIVKQSGATCVGAAIAIEKGFQHGGDELRKTGLDVFSLAIVESMTDDGKITFRN